MARWNSNKEGFSLLSVLIAALLVATGSIAATALVVRAEQVARAGQERFVATQLAREGLELIRAWRDGNWLGRAVDPSRVWTDGLCDNPTFMLDVAMVRSGTPPLAVDPVASGDRLYLIPVTAARGGEWTHQSAGAASASRYGRIMSLDCTKKDSEGIIQVTSMVRWGADAKEQRVILKEEFYDWLPAS